MARKPTPAAPAQPTPYQLLASRIQKQILSPRAQLERRVVIVRQEGEREESRAVALPVRPFVGDNYCSFIQ